MNILSYVGAIIMDKYVRSEKTPHIDTVGSAMSDMPDDVTLCKLAELFRVFGDSTRIRILYALSRQEMSVCSIAELLNASQSAVSHQLQTLREKSLVKYRREGRTVFYSLDDEHIFNIVVQGIKHVKE